MPLTADNRMINYSDIWEKNWDTYIICDKKKSKVSLSGTVLEDGVVTVLKTFLVVTGHSASLQVIPLKVWMIIPCKVAKGCLLRHKSAGAAHCIFEEHYWHKLIEITYYGVHKCFCLFWGRENYPHRRADISIDSLLSICLDSEEVRWKSLCMQKSLKAPRKPGH